MHPHGSERDRLSGCVQLVASGTQRDPGALIATSAADQALRGCRPDTFTDSWTGQPESSCLLVYLPRIDRIPSVAEKWGLGERISVDKCLAVEGGCGV